VASRLARVVTSALLLGGIAACSPGSIKPTAEPAGGPTLGATPAGLPAGTPLVETLLTPHGTLLLGRVFPQASGATALMLVVDDPLKVWSNLVDQASRAGFGLVAGSGGEACWYSTDRNRWWDGPGEVPLSGPRPSAVTGVGCDAYGDAPAGAGGKRRSLTLQMRVGATPEPYLAHLLLQYGVHDDTGTSPAAGPSARVSAAKSASPVVPEPFTQVPAAGAPLGQPFFDGEGYRVAAGSVMLAPAFPAPCGGGGFVAVARVTESAAAVVDRYAEQFRRAGLTTEERREISFGSITASKVSLTTAGGGEGTITTVTAADGTPYLLLERCND
jgi:hypothetical protein